jgi:hypothetical protein
MLHRKTYDLPMQHVGFGLLYYEIIPLVTTFLANCMPDVDSIKTSTQILFVSHKVIKKF